MSAKPLSRTSYRRNPKFTVGAALTKPQQVVLAVKLGRWLYFGIGRFRRVYAAVWISNMNFACVMNYIERKQIFCAIRNPEYPYVFNAKYWESHVPEKSGEWEARCSEIPEAVITAFTKDAVAREAEAAAIKHLGKSTVRVQVKFELPETMKRPMALLTA